MSQEKVVKSTCELCYEGCGVLIHLKGDKPFKVVGDPDDPVNRGAICVKGATSLELIEHPKRLKHPLKRVAGRGEGRWQAITWEEALDEIANRLDGIKAEHGAESVAFMRGGAKGYQDVYGVRLAHAFGSPNTSSMASVCFTCRFNASAMTYGALMLPDYECPPTLIVMWAVNTHNTAVGEWRRSTEALAKGSRLVVIDPWESEPATQAELWVRPRPGTDLALALGMINVIINEGIHDRDFVERWTVGFEKLKEHVQDYPPEKVAEITWVPAEIIRKIARLYATARPACIVLGNGIDNNINNFQTARAIAILRAVTGNLGRPGTDVEWSPSGVLDPSALDACDVVPPDMQAKRLNAQDGFLPTLSYSLPQSILAAALTGRPYPIRAVIAQGTNLLNSLPDAKMVREALGKLDYLVVTDLFMTPTAELADMVLPVSCYLERNGVHEGEYMPVASVVQKVVQTGECRSDYEIFAGLATRMGLGGYFDKSEKEILDSILEPSGMTFEEFKNVGWISGSNQYRKYERVGFETPSRKVELYCSKLAEWGFDALPVYREPPESPVSAPELAKKYPFVLTSHKLPSFQHSQGRMIEGMRRAHPDPIVNMQTDTAVRLGIGQGDWVYIETQRGRIKQRANLVPSIDPRVVIAEHGWWFPEKDSSSLHGWEESNLNILTYSGSQWSREMGTPTLRGIVCNVYKATE